MPNEGDELHHFGTSADTNDGGPSASPSGSAPNRLIFPAQSSGRIYVVDARDPKELRLDKVPGCGKFAFYSSEFQQFSDHRIGHPHLLGAQLPQQSPPYRRLPAAQHIGRQSTGKFWSGEEIFWKFARFYRKFRAPRPANF